LEESISINKFISDTGYCSRREADELIKAGRVLLNGRPAKTGNRFKPGDEVEVDGSLITRKQKEKPVYILLNKPVGITTTTEEHVAGNIISFLNFPKRVFPIGRLDKDSEGLILLTNDGDIVNKVLRAGNAHEKEYQVRVNKPIGTGFVDQMEAGIPILDTVTLPCKVRVTGKQQFTIILTQGLNRQIRRMCEYMGYEVTALRRVRFMHLTLGNLAIGKWRTLNAVELEKLKEAIEESSAIPVKNKRIKPAFSKAIKPKEKSGENQGEKTKPESKPKTKNPIKPKVADTRGKAKTAGAKPGAIPEKEPAKKGSYKAFRQKGRQR
jgi:23S rRNA pseudouridine2604 synthase